MFCKHTWLAGTGSDLYTQSVDGVLTNMLPTCHAARGAAERPVCVPVFAGVRHPQRNAAAELNDCRFALRAMSTTRGGAASQRGNPSSAARHSSVSVKHALAIASGRAQKFGMV